MEEIYISTDIEADGPIPGPNSMLSLGAAAFVAPSTKPVATFEVNLELLEWATPDPDTMKWWREEQPKAWEACRQSLVKPAVGMKQFVDWVGMLPGIHKQPSGAITNAVFVGYPAGFDFTFTYWYIRRFGLQSPFSFSALDIKTYVMAVLGLPFRQSVKRNMPREWFPKAHPHTHVAIDDAVEQGVVFINMLEHARRERSRRSGMQPIIKDEDGKLRFQVNKIVRVLYEHAKKHGLGLNELADGVGCEDGSFSQGDWDQFHQLIGSTIGGYAELALVSESSKHAVAEAAQQDVPAIEGE